MIPERVRATLTGLENQLGWRLADIPVADRDQWTAALRDEMAKLGVDLADPKQALAAFAGAHGVAGLLLPVSMHRPAQATTAAFMRYLADKADEPPARIEER